ncbi:GLIPR1-like protein 1 [Amphiura filiformis]|uniref:GLIPR1-like protein 1 n=1 Tax=Amphiura filiformis TaxID=82378 RepID=UPI003B20C94B
MDSNISTAIFGLFACIAIVVASERKSVVSDPFLFKSNDAEAAENAEHLRYKRADISKIRHLYNEGRVNKFSDAEKKAILDKHLEFRSSVNPEASNMEFMVWNDDLATLAELWASVCYFGHGLTNHTDIRSKFPTIGQNLWSGGAKPDGVSSVEKWHDEKDNYDYDANQCTGGCGHYTQLVWGTSKELGCGRAYCMNTIDQDGNPDGGGPDFIFACQYSPAGNMGGSRPYQTGVSCSACQSESAVCRNKTCDAENPTDGSEYTSTPLPESTSIMSNTTTDESSGLRRMGAAGIVAFCLIIAILVAI